MTIFVKSDLHHYMRHYHLKYAQFASVYYGDDDSKYERIATDVLVVSQLSFDGCL
jgi:hypothetical protein